MHAHLVEESRAGSVQLHPHAALDTILQGCVVLQVRRLRPGCLVRGFFFVYLFVRFVRASDFSFLCLSRFAGGDLLLNVLVGGESLRVRLQSKLKYLTNYILSSSCLFLSAHT